MIHNPTLTKSKYLAGLQCPKLLWITFNDSGKIPPVDPGTQFIFDQGHEVGGLAKKLYPSGVDIPYNSFKESVERTKELLNQRRPLFEASILADNLYARVDILDPAEGGAWDIVEVKSSTQVKDENVADVAFQKYCCIKSGLSIRKCHLMHINNAYVLQGALDFKELFHPEDISQRVEDMFADVSADIEKIFNVVKAKQCPDVTIGRHCVQPYECPLKEHCWGFLPEKNIFNLYWLGKKEKFKLFKQGIHSIADIPGSFKLDERQEIQKNCVVTNEPYVSQEDIRAFLGTLEYPLYYLDFETFNPAVPVFDGTRPYQKIPFQFSLHVVKREGAEAGHHSFLAEGRSDPRPAFLSALKETIGTKGSVIVYNEGFERGVLDDLAAAFPGNAAWIHSVLNRVKDLLEPFRSFYYHHPDQNGSASLKNVLPVLTGNTYEGMNISAGGDASRIFVQTLFNPAPEDERDKARKDLKDYCCLDTRAMMDIVDKLRALCR